MVSSVAHGGLDSHKRFSGAESEGVALREQWDSTAAQVKGQRAEMQAAEFERWSLQRHSYYLCKG